MLKRQVTDKGTTGFIVHGTRLHPVCTTVGISKEMPNGIFAPSDIPNSIKVGEDFTGYIPFYPNVTTLIDQRSQPHDDQLQYPSLEHLTCCRLISTPRSLRSLIIINTSSDMPAHVFTDSELIELSTLNPNLENLHINMDSNSSLPLFPNLKSVTFANKTLHIPKWIAHHPGIKICNPSLQLMSQEHCLDKMRSLEKFHITIIENRCEYVGFVCIRLDIADNVYVTISECKTTDILVCKIGNPRNRCSEVPTGAQACEHTRTILNHVCNDYRRNMHMLDDISSDNAVKRLHITCGSGIVREISQHNWVSKLTQLEKLLICTMTYGEPISYKDFPKLTTLRKLTLDGSVADFPICASPNLSSLTAYFQPEITTLTNLTSLTTRIAGEFPPEIYGLRAIKHLKIQAITRASCCISVFPPGFSSAFPLLEYFTTDRIIITANMCESNRPTLKRWMNTRCPEHPLPAGMARYVGAIVQYGDRAIPAKFPRALLPLYIQDRNWADYYETSEESVHACVHGRIATMREYMQACASTDTWLGRIPRDIVGLIEPFVDEEWLTSIR